ncbi:MAG: cell division protein ZapE [Paracoccaceae bacterium]
MSRTFQQIYRAAVASGEIDHDDAQVAVLPLLEDLQERLKIPQRSRLRDFFSKPDAPDCGLYLWGGVGTGKSMLMDMFTDAVQVPKRRVHFHAFMLEIHARMHEARKYGVDDALAPVAAAVAQQVRLLAFDELQINDITDAMIVGRLFELLLSAGVLIVTTSNRAPDELYKDGLYRPLFLPFIDMLKDRMRVHELASGFDHRQGKLAASGAYFTPADGVARRAIDRLWKQLAGGAGEALVLNVGGREVNLAAFRNGVARARFWDLCGRPLGAADYLELVRNIRVLILEEVPCLSRSNYNEAKRFVTLVDTIYEAGIGLAMSAADVPERLYLEGAGAFEFERTASRLREIQSAGWGVDR